MDCSTFRTHHVDFVDDALPRDLTMALGDHLFSCPFCSALNARVRRSLLAAWNVGAIAPSADFSVRLKRRLTGGPALYSAHATAGNARPQGGARQGDIRPCLPLSR